MGSWACPPSWRKPRPEKEMSDNHGLNGVAADRLVILFDLLLRRFGRRGGLSGRGLSGLVSNRGSLNGNTTREEWKKQTNER